MTLRRGYCQGSALILTGNLRSWIVATTDPVIGIAVVFVADITMDTLDLPPLAMRHCWRQFSQDYP